MLLTLAHIGPRTAEPWAALTEEYLRRMGAYVTAGAQPFKSEKALLEWLAKQKPAAQLILMDSRGKMLSSEALAEFIARSRDQGARHLIFAIGPADGWNEAVTKPANGQTPVMISLGPMTLAHSLARLVLAEQLYRGFTILAGHPYHAGH
jgi:23S rRNA (pseudouridine1915-N3)-methyltransferase